MSYLIAAPEFVSAAATDLANIGETISQANATAASPTSSVLAAGADEVSAAISSLFGAHAQAYQALSTQAASFHQQFVRLLNGGAAQYAHTEAANAQQAALSAINSPVEDLTGRPLIGNGANGTATNPNGAAGGILFGNGGNGFSEPAGSTLNGGNGGNGGFIGSGGAGGA
ncbi:MAG: PE family protein, partial [Mycobacterium sp.]